MNMNEKSLEVKKHVGIIHCSNKLTLLQRKLSNALLYNAYDNLLVQETHEIKIGDLAKLVGYDSHDYDTIKKALKFLMSIVLEWNLLKNVAKKNINEEVQKGMGCSNDIVVSVISGNNLDPKAYSWNASTILASASIEGSICRYSYSLALRELLYMPEIYGKISLFIQSRFKSTYALALYENCVRYKNLEHTGWILLDVFRKLMGVAADKYKKFKDFKRRVLDKAVQEINELSDIYVIVELQNCNQKSAAIRFKINKNPNFGNYSVDKEIKLKPDNCFNDRQNKEINLTENDELICVLREEFGVSEKKLENLLAKYGVEYIWEKINIVKNSASYKEKKVKNLTAYFLSAIKDNFKSNVDASVIMDMKEANRKKEEKLKQEQQKSYKKYVNDTIDQALKNIAPEKLIKIDEEFRKEILTTKLTFVVNKYKENGILDPVIQAFYYDFINTRYSDLVTVVSFEDFIKNLK